MIARRKAPRLTQKQMALGASPMIDEEALNVYTDGSSLPNPRRGGIGVRLVSVDDAGEEVFEDFEYLGHLDATNNQMELLACVEGLRVAYSHPWLERASSVLVRSDSQYVVDNIDNLKFVWPKSGWTRYGGAPVLNLELWKDLLGELKSAPKPVHFKWVARHSKDPHNKAVDGLAKRSAHNAIGKPRKVVEKRRSTTPK